MHTILAAWLGGTELILVLVVVLVLFGARKVPELMKGLGTGIKEFKKATREVTDEIQNATEDKPQPQNKAVTAAPSQPAQTVSQSSNPSKV